MKHAFYFGFFVFCVVAYFKEPPKNKQAKVEKQERIIANISKNEQ